MRKDNLRLKQSMSQLTSRSYDIDNFDLDQKQKEVTMNLKIKIQLKVFYLFIAKIVCIIYHEDV